MIYKIGDEVKIIEGAVTINGEAVKPMWIDKKLIVKDIHPEGYLLSQTKKAPSISAAIKAEYVIGFNEETIATIEIDPYHFSVNTDEAEIHAMPSNDSAVIRKATKFSLFKIVNEKNGWGKLEKGSGWINLNDGIIIRHEEK